MAIISLNPNERYFLLCFFVREPEKLFRKDLAKTPEKLNEFIEVSYLINNCKTLSPINPLNSCLQTHSLPLSEGFVLRPYSHEG